MNVINNKLTKQTKSNMKKRFTFLIAALGLLMTFLATPQGVWGQVEDDPTLIFDFEDETAHRTSGNNSYTSNMYTENDVNIELTYADAVTSGTPLDGSANVIGRVAKKTTNSPVILIGPINIENRSVKKIEYNVKGKTAMSQLLQTSIDGNIWTDQLSITEVPESKTTESVNDLSISGQTLYLKITTSVSTSTESHRDVQIDNIVITYTSSEGNYINISPTTKDVGCEGENVVFSVATDQTLDVNPVVFYTTSEGTAVAEDPTWITVNEIIYDANELLIPVTANTGIARTAYFRVEEGEVKSDVVTINQAAFTVATPTFSLLSGNTETTIINEDIVLLSCETDGATIYYTMGENPENPTNTSTAYVPENGIEVNESTTIKAIAYVGEVASEIATASYTVVHPYNSMNALYNAATESNQPVYVTFTDWVVVAVTNSNAYVTDGRYGINIYQNGHGFTAGKKINGTVSCDLVLYNSGAELTGSNLSASNEDLTVTDAESIMPYEITLSEDIDGRYFGSYVDLGVLTYDSGYETFDLDVDNWIYYDNKFNVEGLPALEDGQTYQVKGVVYYTKSGNDLYRYIAPRIASDILEHNEPIISATSPLEVPDYVKETPVGNIATVNLAVLGANLESDITASLENDDASNFEIKVGEGSWGKTATLVMDGGNVDATIIVRLKSGQNIGDYSDKIILTSTNATTVNVDITGSVTNANVTYDANEATSGTVPTDDADYTYNQSVTVLDNTGSLARTGYTWSSWNTQTDGSGTDYAAGDKFDITADIKLYANWTANTHDINMPAADTYGSYAVDLSNPVTYNASVTLTYTPNAGYENYIPVWSVNGTPISGNTFNMPDADAIVTVRFIPAVTDVMTPATIGVNSSSYTNWSGKKWTSDAIYSGNSSGNSDPASKIQLRSKNNHSGIVTTSTGGKVKKIEVTWNSSTSNANVLNIYGKNSAYTDASDLYDNSDQGTLLGTIVYGTSTELSVSGDYEYVGLRSADGTVYFDEIQVVWAPPTYTVTYDANGGTGTMTDPNSPYAYNQEVTVLSNGFTGPIVDEVQQEFSQWNTVYDGSGTSYNPDGSFSMPKQNVTLYAQWIAPCTVTPTMAAATATKSYVVGGNRYKLELSSSVDVLGGCDITEYGFVYSTSVSTPTVGADNCTKIEIGTSYPTEDVQFETTIADATLGATYYVRSYAINNAGTAYSDVASETIPASCPKYTISYNTNGHDEASSTEINQGNAIGTLLTPNPEYVPDGYTFMGWYNGDSYSSGTAPTLVKTTDVPENNLNLKAMFGISPDGGEKNLEITIDNFTEISNSYETEYTHSYSEATIKAYGVYKNANGIQMNSGKGTYIKNTTAMPGVITKFVLTWKDTGRNSPTMYANANSEASTSSTNLGKQSNETTEQTINTSISDGYMYFYFDGTTVTGACYLSSFKIYYINYYYTTSVTVPSGDYWHVNGNGELTENTTIPAGTYTLTSRIIVPNGMTLTINGHLGTTAANLVIEDGGQLICGNSVAATVKKTIEAPSAKDDVYGWYTISSPVHTGTNSYVTIGNETTVNLTADSYDMFAYDEANAQWLNQKEGSGAAGFTQMNAGQGYMYRNSGNVLSFVGNTNVGAITYPLSYSSTNESLKGFNLIGNPYTHSIAKGSGKAIYDSHLSTGCYALTNSGTWTLIEDGNEIKPNQGILVQTSTEVSDFQINDINYVAPAKYNNDNIKFMVSNNDYEDVTYAWFDKAYGLSKINHRDNKAPMLYIPQDGRDYAIATMSDDTKVFGLNFKAGTMGQYTLSYKATGEYNYLHVIDRLTGEDVDMLMDGKYTFMASPSDNDERFIVKLEYMPDYGEGDSDVFAYQTGSEVLVSGEGELQIFDVTGRMVISRTIMGAEAISVPSQGVYIFRLVGTEVKTQKIVVR